MNTFEMVTEDLAEKLANQIAMADGWTNGLVLLSNTRSDRYRKSARIMLNLLAEDGYLNMDLIYNG